MNGGAWCPKPPITKDAYEYLQIDLGELTVITLVEVQGRFGNGQVKTLTLCNTCRPRPNTACRQCKMCLDYMCIVLQSFHMGNTFCAPVLLSGAV